MDTSRKQNQLSKDLNPPLILPGDLELGLGKFYANRSGSIIKIFRPIPSDDPRFFIGYRFMGKSIVQGGCAEYLPNGRIYTTAAQHTMDLLMEIEDCSPILLYGLKDFGRSVFEEIAVMEEVFVTSELSDRLAKRFGKRFSASQIRSSMCSLIMRKLVHSEPLPQAQRKKTTDYMVFRRSDAAKKMAYRLNLL